MAYAPKTPEQRLAFKLAIDLVGEAQTQMRPLTTAHKEHHFRVEAWAEALADVLQWVEQPTTGWTVSTQAHTTFLEHVMAHGTFPPVGDPQRFPWVDALVEALIYDLGIRADREVTFDGPAR